MELELFDTYLSAVNSNLYLLYLEPRYKLTFKYKIQQVNTQNYLLVLPMWQ